MDHFSFNDIAFYRLVLLILHSLRIGLPVLFPSILFVISIAHAMVCFIILLSQISFVVEALDLTRQRQFLCYKNLKIKQNDFNVYLFIYCFIRYPENEVYPCVLLSISPLPAYVSCVLIKTTSFSLNIPTNDFPS